jgi:hypothetical protein
MIPSVVGSVSIPTNPFSDILLASSGDGGSTWSAPVRVDDNVEDGTQIMMEQIPC